jgi:hypothetical protein
MLQLKNATPFAGAIALLPDAQGVDTVFAVVKGTFALDSRLAPAEAQVPIVPADQHYGDPATSSVRAPCDICLDKPGTDVVLLGSAYAPGGRAAWSMDVTLTAGPLSKTVRVWGDRVWDAGPAGAVVAHVAPFERMPLVWERAYGGVDETEKGPVAYGPNPAGRGFRGPRSAAPLHGRPLPNLEDPAALIVSPSASPTPACFAPVAPHWEPRRSYAGTYDATWQASRAPYLPSDFDSRFFQIAPRGLSAGTYFRGGEWVQAIGVTPNGLLQFQLPTIDVGVRFRLSGGDQQRRADLDTVIIEPDLGRVIIVWRAALPCDKKALKVREIETTLTGAAA